MRAEHWTPPPIETTNRITFTNGWMTVVVDPDQLSEAPGALRVLADKFDSGEVDDAIDLAVLDQLPEHDPEAERP